MQTIKFQNMREKRQELFNVDNYTFNKFMFDSGERNVYSNVNLSIFVDDYCNADCDFCVAQLRFENRGQMYKKSKIDSLEEYMVRLDQVFKRIRPLNPSISITGGEPTWSDKLPFILDLINEYGFRKRTLTTNGSGLLRTSPSGKGLIINDIINNEFQHLNISKVHYDEEINQKIMKYQKGYTSNEDLRKIILFSKANNLRPRMSCLLLQSGIHTLEDMIKYMEFYQNLGIDNVIFRELMDFDNEKMINHEKVAFCKQNKVYLNDLWKQIDTDSRFTKIKNILGYYYYVEIYKYQNVDMCSESANLVKLYEQKAIHNDIVFEMIFHPNGNLNGSWVDNEDILLKYNKN